MVCSVYRPIVFLQFIPCIFSKFKSSSYIRRNYCVSHRNELVSAVPSAAVHLEILRRCSLYHVVWQTCFIVDGTLVVVNLACQNGRYFGAVNVFFSVKCWQNSRVVSMLLPVYMNHSVSRSSVSSLLF